VHAQEAVGQNAAVQKSTQLPLDEAGNDAISSTCVRNEYLEMPGNDAEGHRLLGSSRPVLGADGALGVAGWERS
jgi:hypothetical protein